MSTKPQEELPRDQKKQECQKLNAAIGRHVMNALGQPGDQHRIQVKPLWDDHYRVNVIVGKDVNTAKVAHSYFLVTDESGNIIDSAPKIKKEY